MVAEVQIDKGTWYRETLREGKSEMAKRQPPDAEHPEMDLDDSAICERMNLETNSYPRSGFFKNLGDSIA